MSRLIEAVGRLTELTDHSTGLCGFFVAFPLRRPRSGDSNDPTSFCTLVTDKID